MVDPRFESLSVALCLFVFVGARPLNDDRSCEQHQPWNKLALHDKKTIRKNFFLKNTKTNGNEVLEIEVGNKGEISVECVWWAWSEGKIKMKKKGK